MVQTINIGIEGMTCAACAQRIEKVLNKDPNITEAVINLATETGQIAFDSSKLSEADIFAKIKSIGYQPVKAKADQEAIAKAIYRRDRIRLIVAIVLSVPLLATMLEHLPFLAGSHLTINPWVQLVLAGIVQFVIAAPFYLSAYRAIRGGIANMDVLVVLGTTVAYLVSVVNTFRFQFAHLHHPMLYFETSAILITFVLLGKHLEKRAKAQTTAAITSLVKLQPNEAIIIEGDVEKKVAIKDIRLDDVVKVLPGAKIPVDGVIIKGSTTVDESLLTGESLPIDKGEADAVIAGSVNQNGLVLIRVTKIGQDTTLAQIIKIIENAQGEKVPIQRLADKISSVFVPIVIGISLVAFVVWLIITRNFYTALNAGVSVLVIACPCALGLATPTAIMVGSGVSAKSGILFKGGQFLEILQKVDTVVFDKTGTLTTGRPEVVQIDVIDQSKLPLIITAETGSEHPLSQAIVRFGKKEQLATLTLEHFTALLGAGLKAVVEGQEVVIGNRQLMQQYGVDLANQDTSMMANQGQTVVFAAVDNQLIATIGIEDTIKVESKQAVARLHQMNKRVIMLSGDNQQTAQAIAVKIGITEVLAEVFPSEKAEKIKALQANGRVAMVGDGVNDAPALVVSDVGIAIGTGSDVAIESADVTLMTGDVTNVAKSIDISRKTMQTIRENLFWALIYNLVGIPIAAFGLLLPWIAGAAMAFSSISVVLNSLRLKWRRI